MFNKLLGLTLLIVTIQNLAAAGTCADASFDLDALVTTYATYGENKISVSGSNSPKTPRPAGFANDKEYKDICLKSIDYQLTKTSAPTIPIETKTILATDLQTPTFSNLDYLVEYEVQMFYTQKSPNSNKNLGFTKVLTTCFGQPSNVRNVEAIPGSDGVLVISWEKPAVLNAPDICYYEVVVTEKDEPSNKFTYKTNKLSIRDTHFGNKMSKTISVISINDNIFDGSVCYAAPSSCKTRGSGAETTTWIYTPPVTTSTKKPNKAQSVYSFQYMALISVFCLNVVFLI